MNDFPATFIQIHYHNRHGGVKQVIDRYSELCTTDSSDNTQTVFICSSENPEKKSNHSKLVNEPLLDYRSFNSQQEFDEIKSRIQSTFSSVICSSELKKPVAVLFHNISLGKNCAASAAFTQVAREFGSDEVRFFAVLHDFAEEGRSDMLELISNVQEWRSTIYEDLYCSGAPVTFVVPGKQSFDILKKLQFPVILLPNSVHRDHTNVDLKIVSQQLFHTAKKQNPYFDSSRPLWYYPSRIIQRKNILEAVLLSRLFDTALILGPESISPRDKKLVHALHEIILKCKLNIFIDPSQCDCFRECNCSPVPSLYELCDCAVSTSVAEGFGYGLFEPFFYNKPLLGRKPEGFLYPCDASIKNLYRMLPIPADLINKEVLIGTYYKKFGKTEIVDKKTTFFDETNLIDFADLDILIQKNCIERFINDNKFRKLWLHILESESSEWPGLENIYQNAINVFSKNRFTLLEYFSIDNYRRRFSETFSCIPAKHTFEFWKIAEMFQNKSLNLLL
jgi:hypothetical protein